ncbi:hypothetical protein VTJ83DRAFT_842 [Remersonia thermophila]|uniref:DUF4211 domain-containing protein n=1 Tax=Remersonia thermophila TaxID=72144 RepID=A0ABR4DMB0_9PEZI
MGKRKRERQQTLEATLGRPPVRRTIKIPKQQHKTTSSAFPSSSASAPAPSSSPAATAKSSPAQRRLGQQPLSFMALSQPGGSVRSMKNKKKRLAFEDDGSSEDRGSAAEDDDDDEADEELPVKRRGAGRYRQSRLPNAKGVTTGGCGAAEDEDLESRDAEEKEGEQGEKCDDDDDDDDDLPIATPMMRRKRRAVIADSGDSDDDDDDDTPLVPSSKRRKLVPKRTAASSPIKGRKNGGGDDDSEDDNDDDDQDSDGETEQQPVQHSTRSRRVGGRKRMTQKEKARELLRRKRAGEVVDENDESSEPEDDEPAKGLYDTDSDNLALNEFEDDEEGVIGEQESEPSAAKKGKKKKKKKRKKKQKDDGSNEEEMDDDMDSFVVDDSDEPLGVPSDAYLDIPIEFTSHAHKPLKEHFRDAIEWCVQFKVNPGFSERCHGLYRIAWKRLDDEVHGLATSKFASSAWKKDFYMALRARPYYVNTEVPKADRFDGQNCGACGRSGHPAKFVIKFSGSPYYKNAANLELFLRPVEVNSTDSEQDGSNNEAAEPDVDEDGHRIPPAATEWRVGAVCGGNAETAHDLMHWKHALLDWVDARLHEEGHMLPERLADRERMRPKKLHKVVDGILDRWDREGVVRALYQDFKATLEAARNKSTSGRYR